VLSSVRLPGRLSRHELPGSRTELIVDAAINRAGIAAALAVAARWWTRIDHVLVCLPDHKDVSGAIRELAGLPVTFVRLPDEHLRFAQTLPADWTVIDAADLTRELVAGLGGRVMALGTVYFAGRVLDLADADTERLFIC
jgi:dihydrofolate synthase / folylpolyglutamate synthase